MIIQINPSKPVLVPGDPERDHTTDCNEKNKIPYHINQIKLIVINETSREIS